MEATLSSGVRLDYVEQGNPGGTPVVFLHGVTDSWRSFERLLPLLPSSIHAFALSQRGHGDSSRPASGYRIADMSDDVRAFMDLRGLRTATIVGHSMGSSVAQRFAVDHPERTTALFLIGAFATFQGPEFREFVISSIRPLVDPIGAGYAREWQLSTLAKPMDPVHLDTVVAETLKVPAFVWHAAFEGFLATDDFSSQLATVSAPVLLVWGDHDAYANRAGQETLFEVIPNVRLITYEGHGHAVHWEDPERVAADLVAFIAEQS